MRSHSLGTKSARIIAPPPDRLISSASCFLRRWVTVTACSREPMAIIVARDCRCGLPGARQRSCAGPVRHSRRAGSSPSTVHDPQIGFPSPKIFDRRLFIVAPRTAASAPIMRPRGLRNGQLTIRVLRRVIHVEFDRRLGVISQRITSSHFSSI